MSLEVIEVIRKKDHWEVLEWLAGELRASADNVENIANSFEKIRENRRELPSHLAEIQILLEVCKSKLIILPEEWETVYTEVSEDLKNSLSTEDYKDMEF